jgi:hypothetical protein
MALMKIGAAKEPFDVIITDHRMPRMNGLDLVRRLRVAQVRGQDYCPLGASDQGEHTGLRGVEGGYDVRETLRLRRVATRDEPPNERRIRAGQRAPDGAGLSSSAVAIGSSCCSLTLASRRSVITSR